MDEASLRAAAERARTALQARLDEAGAIAPAAGDDDLAAVQQRMRVLLGPGFVALPRFLAPDADDLVARGTTRRWWATTPWWRRPG